MGHDYLIGNLRNRYIDGNSVFGREMRKEAADLITDLLARAEEAEARVRELEKLLSAVQNMENFHPDETGFFVFTKKDADDITGKLLAAEARAEKAERERDEALEILHSYRHICGEMPPEQLSKLVEAHRDGRCAVLPSGGYTDKDGENALKSAMNTCFYHNNPVTRYIADAVAEKLTREAEEDAIVKGCANKAESTLGKQLREFYSEELIDAVLKGDK